MSLYDLLGPVAVATGLGALYGSVQSHGIAFWFSGAIAGAGGIAMLAGMWALTGKVASQASPNIERHLAFMYVATFTSVLLVTFFSGRGALWLTALA